MGILPRARARCGTGHMTLDECERIETGTGTARELWEEFPCPPGRYANAAGISDRAGRRLLEAKGHPSPEEDQAGCHLGHRRLRVLETADGLRVAVVICSEMLPTYDPEDVVNRLADRNIHLLIWLQHNSKPRDERFLSKLNSLYQRVGSPP